MKKILLIVLFFILSSNSFAADKETAYDRVMRTNTLRCGYVVFPPWMDKDPNTGKLSGIGYELTEALGKRMNLKIDWVEETNFATIGAALQNNRFDALCFTLYRWTPAARAVDYSRELMCSPTYIYVRKDDKRFDKDLTALNNSKISVGSIDGEGSDNIAADDFPKMSVVSMPQSTDLSQLMLGLIDKKYDVVFANPIMVKNYVDKNPDKIKNISLKPLRYYCQGFAFKKGEQDLINTLNIGFEEMLNFGIIDKILDKYEYTPNTFLRIKQPWADKTK